MTLRTVVCLTAILGACSRSAEPPLEARAPVPPSQVCVVRHAEAFKNLDPRPPDLTPEQLDALTPEGEARARQIGPTLPEPVAIVWTSPANRTRQTAALLGLDPPVQTMADLRSIEGDVNWSERLRTWEEGEDPRPEAGESLADVQVRIKGLLTRLPDLLGPGENAVLVTHGDIVAVVLGELRGTPLLQRPTTDMLQTGQAACMALVPDTAEHAGNGTDR